jgi:hypothetical protein
VDNGPLGTVRVAIEIRPWGPDTLVIVDEHPLRGPGGLLHNSLVDALIQVRHRSMLSRLAGVVEQATADRPTDAMAQAQRQRIWLQDRLVLTPEFPRQQVATMPRISLAAFVRRRGLVPVCWPRADVALGSLGGSVHTLAERPVRGSRIPHGLDTPTAQS